MNTSIKTDIKTIISNRLGVNFYYGVNEYQNFFGREPYLKIFASVSDININGVKGQKPQLVSLHLDLNTMELTTQIFGCMGGGKIYRQPITEDEKFYAMVGIKIPFRKPKNNYESVLKAIDKFFLNYKESLKANVENLRYKDIVDYESVLRWT